MRRKIFGLALTLVLGAACTNQPADWITLDGRSLSYQEIDATVERLTLANDVKGLAVALIKDGEVGSVHGYGMRMVEPGLPLKPNTIIYGASLTKPTFTYLVMQLVDEGLVDLDQPIGEYFAEPLPQYEHYADLAGDERWRDLTLRVLLSHTTGFPNWRFFDYDGNYEEDGKLAIYFSPGSRYAYSGEGYELAQFVLEEGLGLDVGAEMQRRIFTKFDMPKTSMTWREDFLENYSHNYTLEGKNIRHSTRSKVGAAGSMDTTPADWAKFLSAVVRGEGLSAKAKDEMFRTQIRIQSATQFPTLHNKRTDENDGIELGYGLGWGVFETPFGRAFFKEGHDDGTANYALCVEPKETCVLLMSNSVRAEGIFKELMDFLLGETRLPWRWEGYIPYDLDLDSVE